MTASAISAAASGRAVAPGARAWVSSRTAARSGSRAKRSGSRPLDSGHGPRQLAGDERPCLQAAAEVDGRAHLEPDERHHDDVAALGAEEQPLELGVLALVEVVVPVEAAARVCDAGDEGKQDGLEGGVLPGPPPGQRTGEERGGRLAGKLVEGVAGVGQLGEPFGAALDEREDQRPELVEGRAPARVVLLEGERHLGAVVDLALKRREGGEGKEPQRGVQVGRPVGHPSGLRGGRRHSCADRGVRPSGARSLIQATGVWSRLGRARSA